MSDSDIMGEEVLEDEDWDDGWDGWDENWGDGQFGDGCDDEKEAPPVPLTQRVNDGGWSAKWRADEFQCRAQNIAPAFSGFLKDGLAKGDDCFVLRINDEQATVFTLDWFPAVVDDPYDFGAISAAAALSNLYAMGAKPMTALNVMALPCKLGVDEVGEVMRGGSDKVIEAGAFVVGGHSIDDNQPKYGLAAFGTINPDKVIHNEHARPGDVLFYTKPLGSGIMIQAYRDGLETEGDLREAADSMMELNKPAAQAMEGLGVHAAETVSGSGLVGHLHDVLEACGAAATIDWDSLPLLDRAWQHCRDGCRPQRTEGVVEWATQFVDVRDRDDKTRGDRMAVLCDPQTSGGLIVAVAPEDADAYAEAFRVAAGRTPARIGTIVEGEAGLVTVM